MVIYQSCPRGQLNHAEVKEKMGEFEKVLDKWNLIRNNKKSCVMKSGSLERDITAQKTSKKKEKSS